MQLKTVKIANVTVTLHNANLTCHWYEQQERQERLHVKLSCLSEHVRRKWVYEFVSNKGTLF